MWSAKVRFINRQLQLKGSCNSVSSKAPLSVSGFLVIFCQHSIIIIVSQRNTNLSSVSLFVSFLSQQLFRSNPGLTAPNSAIPGAPNGQPLPQSALSLSAQQQQFLQHNAAYAAAAQQAAPYVINPGQDPSQYMSLIAAGVPQYYGVAAPWNVYPASLAIPQQQSQPRRPLTPSQQGAENQPYQVRDCRASSVTLSL